MGSTRICSSTSRGYHTDSHSRWINSSMAAVSEACPELEQIQSEDSKILLVLLCFLGQAEIPLNLLSYGSSSRKRWSELGEIMELNALDSGLLRDLTRICLHPARLEDALSILEISSAISRSNKCCQVYQHIRDTIFSKLPMEHHPLWKLQAFIIAYRSITWKYLER